MTTAQQQSFSFASRGGEAILPVRNLVLEAGAGTGKTTAIVAEVLKRLLGTEEVSPERIVLVTFTEKAAGEIGDRIEKAIEEIAEQLATGAAVRWPPKSDQPLFEVAAEQRDACRAAVDRVLPRIDRLRSQTIHSFCQSLLRQFPIEAGIDPQFRVVEGFDRTLFYGEVYDSWIEDETRLHPRSTAAEEWEAVLDHYGYLFRVRETIFLLVDRRHLLLEDGYDIGSIAEYEPLLHEAIDSMRLAQSDNRVSAYFRSAQPPPSGSTLQAWIDYFAPAAIDLRQLNMNNWRECKDAIKVLRGDKKGSCVYDLLISHCAAVALLSLTRRFIARLDEEKRTRGLLDFDDLLLGARALLRDRQALERIRNQFDCMFVDEFQDTDSVQAEIMDRLSRDSSGAFVPGKITVVGDPKQSIYAFRRADPETYARFTGALKEAGARSEQLLHQYRSVPTLVEALNAIGVPLFAGGEKNPNVFRPEYHELRVGTARSAAGEAPAATPPLTMLGCAPGDGSRPQREAEAIAQWILGQEHGDWRRFALLFRRRTKVDEYLEVFERLGIPCVVPPVALFLDGEAAVDLMAVLRAIAWRFDRGAAISAARTPYFALTDREIADGLLKDGDGPWKNFCETMESLRDASRHLTVTELIDHVVATAGIEAVYAQAHDGPRLLRQLEQLRAVAFAYDQNAGGSIRQFVGEIARRRETPEEAEPSLLDESTNAVRVLTIHGAKGLEFDTVILPDIEFSTHGGQGLEMFTVDEPRSLVIRNGLDTLSGVCRFSEKRPLQEIAKLRDDAETRRLFYVAITRAKSQVAIVCDPAKKMTQGGFGKFLIELGIDATHFPAEPGRVVAEIPIDGKIVPVAYEWRAGNPACPDKDRQDCLSSTPCVVPRPESVVTELTAADIAIARNASGKKAAGILLHRVLERWDGRSEVAPLLAQLAAEQAADSATADLVRRRFDVVVRSAMFRRIAAAETIGREMPLIFFDEAGALVEKRVDRLIRENGEDTVTDYKSGAPSEERLVRDREQVAAYCQAVARMTGRACNGLLWYIDVDNDRTEEVRGSRFE